MPPERTSRKRTSQNDGVAKKKRKKPVREDEGDLDVEAGLNRAFERMDGQLVADYIAQKTTRFGTDLSSVELSDLYISGAKTSPDIAPKKLTRRSKRYQGHHNLGETAVIGKPCRVSGGLF